MMMVVMVVGVEVMVEVEGDTKPGKSLSQGGHNVVQLFAGDISEFQGQQTKQMKNKRTAPSM